MKFVWKISRPPCQWCEFGQVFKWAISKNGLMPNGQKWADNDKILVRIILNLIFWPNRMAGCWDNWGFIGHRVTEWQSYKVTDTQGYSVYGWVKFFLYLILIKSPTRFPRRGIMVNYLQLEHSVLSLIGACRCY